MSNNLSKFIALEKLITAIGHGRVDLQLQLRSGGIVGVTTTGTKRTLYNMSEEDVHGNQTALEDVVKRVAQQLESGVSSELVFRIKNFQDKIKSIEVESTQTIK